jgi:hypothetical protein
MTATTSPICMKKKKCNIFFRLIHDHKGEQNKLLIKFETSDNIMNFDIIKFYMYELKFTDNDISNCQFIINKKCVGKKLNVLIKHIILIEIKPKNIQELKKKALEIFTKNSIILKNEKKHMKERKDKNERIQKLNKQLNKKVENVITINCEKLITKNKEFLKKLSNPDFLYLLKLYKSKPELFSDMYQFVSNTTSITKVNLQNVNLDDFKLYEEVYDKLKTVLSGFKLNIPEDTCKKLLKLFEGNYDRTFRYLLSESYLK